MHLRVQCVMEFFLFEVRKFCTMICYNRFTAGHILAINNTTHVHLWPSVNLLNVHQKCIKSSDWYSGWTAISPVAGFRIKACQPQISFVMHCVDYFELLFAWSMFAIPSWCEVDWVQILPPKPQCIPRYACSILLKAMGTATHAMWPREHTWFHLSKVISAA